MLHKSVLLKEVILALSLRPGFIVVDGTMGSGGHSEAILEAIGPSGRLIGLDQDEEAVGRSLKRLDRFKSQLVIRCENFRNIDLILSELNISSVNAVLLDIGVSLEQLTDGNRGFSFRLPGPLDMRMSRQNQLTAAELIEKLSEIELSEIFHKFGEERYAKRIAHWIVEERNKIPMNTTTDFAKFIEEKIPKRIRGRQKIHPATRIFQALRIVVNDELAVLEEGIDKALKALSPDGRLAVITFHSLEDRIVKWRFRKEGAAGKVKIITKKPMVPSAEEVIQNLQSRSAKLRVVEKI